MERCDRVEIWRQPLFLRPHQLDLFGRAGSVTSIVQPDKYHIRVADNDGGIVRLLRDVYPRVRDAVVCMTTAAHLHDLLPGLPTPLWLGVPLRVHVPQRGKAELHVLRWSNSPAFDVGVEQIEFRDVTLLRTTRERTIVDLVRYARRLGGSATAARCLRAYSAVGGREADVRRMADAVRLPRPARVVLDVLLAGMDAAS